MIIYIHTTFFGAIDYFAIVKDLLIRVIIVCMVQIHPKIKKQLSDLKSQVSVAMAEKAPAIIIDVPIGQLKPHDMARVLFVVSNAFVSQSNKQKIMLNVFKESVDEIKELVTASNEMSKDQVIAEIQRIILKPKIEDSL